MTPIRKTVSKLLGVQIAEGWDSTWKAADEMGKIKSNAQPILLELCKAIEGLQNDVLPEKSAKKSV